MRIKLNVNEEKRVVVAYVTKDELWDRYEDIISPDLRLDGLYPMTGVADILHEIPGGTLVAKAKCNPEDVWNPDIGIKLAKSRLRGKIRRYDIRVYESIIDTITHATAKALEPIYKRYDAITDDESRKY